MAVTPQTNTTLAELAEVLFALDDIVVCGHVSPDGDCIGSALAVVNALRESGKRATALSADPIPESLAFLPGAADIVLTCDYTGPVGCFFAVDVPDLARLGTAGAALHASAPVTLRLDHHAYPERVSDYSYTAPDAVSATTLVWEMLGHQVERSAAVATCCYAGLVTDSGRFEFQNTDERAFRLAAEMIAVGVNPGRVTAELYENERLAALQLEMRAFERMELDAELGYALTYLTAADFAEFDAVKADAEGVVNLIRRLRDVRVLCCLREQDDTVRLSFRAKSDIDVREIAQRFGGGGHVAASGATMHVPLAEAYAQVKAALREACS